MPQRLVGGQWVDIPSFEFGPEVGQDESGLDMAQVETLVERYPELAGQIQTQADLEHILVSLKAEDGELGADFGGQADWDDREMLLDGVDGSAFTTEEDL